MECSENVSIKRKSRKACRLVHLQSAFVTPEGSAKSMNYVVGGSLTTQLALVNLGCVAVHVANSRVTSLRQPDRVCFDLDPESGRFGDAAQAALHIQEALEVLRLMILPINQPATILSPFWHLGNLCQWC